MLQRDELESRINSASKGWRDGRECARASAPVPLEVFPTGAKSAYQAGYWLAWKLTFVSAAPRQVVTEQDKADWEEITHENGPTFKD